MDRAIIRVGVLAVVVLALGACWAISPPREPPAIDAATPTVEPLPDLGALRRAAESALAVEREAHARAVKAATAAGLDAGKAEGELTGRSAVQASIVRTAGWIHWWAGIAFLFAGAAFVVSFTPLGSLVPKGLAGGLAAAAGAAWLAGTELLAHGEAVVDWLFWFIVVGGSVAALAIAVPAAVTLIRWSIRRTGASLVAEGDVRAGVALAAVADRRVNRSRASLADAAQRIVDGGGRVLVEAETLLRAHGLPAPVVRIASAAAAGGPTP